MQLKNLDTGVALPLPDDLLWSDEHAWSPAVASTSYLITGALLIQSATRQAGRPITLVGAPDMAWVTRAAVEQLRAWAALAVSEADEVIRRLVQHPHLLEHLTSLSVLGPVSEVGFGYMLANPELFQRISRLEISRRRVRSSFFQKQVLPVLPQLRAVAVQWGTRRYPFQQSALQRVPDEWVE